MCPTGVRTRDPLVRNPTPLPLRHSATFRNNRTFAITIVHSKIINQRINGPVNAHLISGHIRFLKFFTINEHGGHLGHVACTIASFPPLNDFVTVFPFKH